ncbi:dihydroneopterin aldolase [Limosilactobacillus fermentum]|uniref:dihydroneopterin aldolase n=1 Tax=Limosilactobacillus fermentum TaxID=1613 RepID=UPI001023D7D0|nr:dihydroneopterin aldolase [Limosilactobacillus fermentum]QBE60927.1 dihydroneopterin aldolase [Limosilactobacillus fermentum]
MGQIRINNMVFHTYNGVFAEEKRMGQRLEVDLDMSYPIETAVQHDELTETVSYAGVYDTTKEFLEGHQFNLIESAANGLLKTLQTQYPALGTITVRIRKYAVPIAGVFDNIEIEVTGRASDVD